MKPGHRESPVDSLSNDVQVSLSFASHPSKSSNNFCKNVQNDANVNSSKYIDSPNVLYRISELRNLVLIFFIIYFRIFCSFRSRTMLKFFEMYPCCLYFLFSLTFRFTRPMSMVEIFS